MLQKAQKTRKSMMPLVVALVLVGFLGFALHRGVFADDPPSWKHQGPDENEYLLDVEILPSPRKKLVRIKVTIQDVPITDQGYRTPWGDLVWIPTSAEVIITATQTEPGRLACSITHMRSQRIISTMVRRDAGTVECFMNKKTE